MADSARGSHVTEEPWWKQGLAELIGAFALVFVGAGTFVATAGQGTDPAAAFLARAIASGVVIMAMASALAHISGGQISSAVTVGLLAAGKIRAPLAGVIIAFQLAGSILAGFLLLVIYPSGLVGLGTPRLGLALEPVESTASTILGIAIELVLTFFLVFVVFATVIDPRGAAKQVSALPIGLTVMMCSFVGGNLTGAAISPGRWLGPAVATWNFDQWYIYAIGPVVGGVIAGVFYAAVFLPKET
jgi:glycerol uptake facilitator-like aquaporin